MFTFSQIGAISFFLSSSFLSFIHTENFLKSDLFFFCSMGIQRLVLAMLWTNELSCWGLWICLLNRVEIFGLWLSDFSNVIYVFMRGGLGRFWTLYLRWFWVLRVDLLYVCMRGVSLYLSLMLVVLWWCEWFLVFESHVFIENGCVEIVTKSVVD